MKKSVAAGIGMLAVTGLLAGCSSAGSTDSEGPVTLTFQSLAFQETTIAATEEIVAAWNEENPDIQVEITQGSWDNVQDQLVTQFQGGTAPDVIHYESASILGFAEQGYLADLSPYLSDEVVDSVSEEVWGTVTSSTGDVVAAPTLLQSYVVFANTDAFDAAGVEIPTGDSMTWDQFAELSASLTGDGKFGIGWGLSQPTATVMNMALGFDGDFFENEDGASTIDVGAEELEVPKRIHEMAYVDQSIEPVSLTQSGSDTLPGFYDGTYAMFFGGNFYAQSLTESAPDGFNWAVLPPLAGDAGTEQAANPQTMSVPAESENVEEAAAFIDFFMNAENQAALAQGDWLIPSSSEARDLVLEETGGEAGWGEILQSGESLTVAPFQSAVGYTQWKDQIATPALQQYFANDISLNDLQSQLTEGFETLAG